MATVRRLRVAIVALTDPSFFSSAHARLRSRNVER